ncbi:hypothetical protein CFK38_04130 [Brachybacterium vulturis]|uniref:Uncharacterized protein n=1 Tax=Brachybacterium vulturis TaxID=2017484 RepID=A0A291GJV6_9MICO|nr:hypothetical protein [Brachybacterium vulturis]ATG50803.1 hypothetical protein CFK38_04130 [Brachybacterium vulturis]
MSDGRFIADTLETVIVGMADSLTEAHEQLSTVPPLDSSGRPNPQYRLPHLDFEIGFRLVTETTQDGRRAFLYFRPVSSSSSSSEVTSKISGRFVAIPPGEGMPLPVLTLTASGTGSTRQLQVQASTTAGELLAGATVQLNIDVAASQALSATAGVTDARLTDSTSLTAAVLTTDPQGRASTEVSFGAQLRTEAVVLITAELGTTISRIITGKAI